MAEATGISEGYIEQLLIPLKKAGIVRGIRGPQGGYLTGMEPERITVGTILRTAEGALEPTECVSEDELKNKCPMSADCKSRNIWAELYREINHCVDSISLADLAESCKKTDQVEYAI
jgi:Rrf2 family protein